MKPGTSGNVQKQKLTIKRAEGSSQSPLKKVSKKTTEIFKSAKEVGKEQLKKGVKAYTDELKRDESGVQVGMSVAKISLDGLKKIQSSKLIPIPKNKTSQKKNNLSESKREKIATRFSTKLKTKGKEQLKKGVKAYTDELKRDESGVQVAVSGLKVSGKALKKIQGNLPKKSTIKNGLTKKPQSVKPKNLTSEGKPSITKKQEPKTTSSFMKKELKDLKSTSKKISKSSSKLQSKDSKLKKGNTKLFKDEKKVVLSKKSVMKKQIQKKQIKQQLKKKTVLAYQKQSKSALKRMRMAVTEFAKSVQSKIAYWIGSAIVPFIPLIMVILLLLTGTLFVGGALSKLREPERVSIGARNLSPEVEKWRSLVEKIAKEQGMEDYTGLILAIIQVESGGTGTRDIMQSSESAGKPVNFFQSEEQSVRQGVHHLRNIVSILASYGKGYEKDYKLIAQAYNFGSAFARYVGNRGGEYSLAVAESYSKNIVAPSLGNRTGATYSYINEVSVKLGKPYLYLNGGNFMYGDKVAEYVGGGGKDPSGVIQSVYGRGVGNGECYALTSYYAKAIGGPGLGAGVGEISDTTGADTVSAYNIGIAYNWSKYGWEVVRDPDYSQIQAGDIVNWYPSGYFNGIWGHTGIVKEVLGNGVFTTYEQNAGKGRIVAEYTRNIRDGRISSIIHPPK
ncbi:TPA: lysozyme family protein [Streptococcus suis]|nr:lysozyme family protein [Streptococcus suis]